MTIDDAFEISTGVIAQKVGDEVVVLDVGSGTYFGLDPVGARIWEMIGEGWTLLRICDAMLVEYDVTRETMECDILNLVEALRKENLVGARR